MAFVKLALVFAAIIILLTCKRPLWQSILGGLLPSAASMLLCAELVKNSTDGL